MQHVDGLSVGSGSAEASEVLCGCTIHPASESSAGGQLWLVENTLPVINTVPKSR